MLCNLSVWVGRITYSVLLIITVCVFTINIYKRRACNYNRNVHRVLLDIWSIIGFGSCCIVSLLSILIFIPTICEFTSFLRPIFWNLSILMISFYEIATLHSTFSIEQIHDKHYGYSNCLFVFLYFTGVVLIIGQTFQNITLVHYHPYEHQCVEHRQTHGHNGHGFQNHCIAAELVFLVWDTALCILYLVKLCQMNRIVSDAQNNDTNSAIISGIRLNLQKITILNMVHISLNIFFYLRRLPNEGDIMNETVIPSSSIVVTCGILYLMIDYNNEDYIRLVTILSCGCCRSQRIHNECNHMTQTSTNAVTLDTVHVCGSMEVQVHELPSITRFAADMAHIQQ
eukprot:325195_1